jgi:uncharacterized protein YPO0396
MRAFVDQAAAHGGALIVSGEAGVGKTALIDAATAFAVQSGLRVLRATHNATVPYTIAHDRWTALWTTCQAHVTVRKGKVTPVTARGGQRMSLYQLSGADAEAEQLEKAGIGAYPDSA